MINYDDMFRKADLDMDGYVNGAEVKDLFIQSGIAQPVLAHIWNLCDTQGLGKLNTEQFALAMHLVQLKVKGMEPPPQLTPEMVPPSMRKQGGYMQGQVPATIVRQSEHTQRLTGPEEELSYIPAKSVRQKLQELQDRVHQEQSVIMQTSNALNQCCGQNSTFAGSKTVVECNCLLLIALKKHEAFLAEMQRLRSGQVSNPDQPHGSLTISDIRLPLEGDFTSMKGTPHDNTVHYFICMVRHRDHVIMTEMISTHEASVQGTLEFRNLIKISDVAEDFRVDLEIYGMAIAREDPTLTPKKKSNKDGHSLQSPGGPSAVRSTDFTHISSVPLHLYSLNKTHFTLERLCNSSPLQGTIYLRLRSPMVSSESALGTVKPASPSQSREDPTMLCRWDQCKWRGDRLERLKNHVLKMHITQ